jgi:hypothetical protein
MVSFVNGGHICQKGRVWENIPVKNESAKKMPTYAEFFIENCFYW